MKGSMTIETVYILPMLFLVFFLSVTGLFYYHDKNILISSAYEAVMVGSRKGREAEGVTAAVVEEIFQERIHGKCIFFSDPIGKATVTSKEVQLEGSVQRGKMGIVTKQSAPITKPEEKIRQKVGMLWHLN